MSLMHEDEQRIRPPDDQLPTGGTIPIQRLVESCKLEVPISDFCRDLHTELTEGMEHWREPQHPLP